VLRELGDHCMRKCDRERSHDGSRHGTKVEETLLAQQSRYDQTWQNGLESGKEHRGDLQANLAFLSRTGLLQDGDAMLEIGCGIGTIVYELSRQGHDIRGTDISSIAVAYGLAKYGR